MRHDSIFDDLQQTIESLVFVRIRDIVFHCSRRSALSWRIDKSKGGVVLNLFAQCKRIKELLLALIGETNDDVRCDCTARNFFAYFLHESQIFFSCITPAHFSKDLVVPRLQRQMDAMHDVRIFGNHLKHFGREIPGVTGHKTKARDSRFRNFGKAGRKVCPIFEVLAVAIHVFAKESNLLKTFIHEFSAFLNDFV